LTNLLGETGQRGCYRKNRENSIRIVNRRAKQLGSNGKKNPISSI
jgi:hypothetical protein